MKYNKILSLHFNIISVANIGEGTKYLCCYTDEIKSLYLDIILPSNFPEVLPEFIVRDYLDSSAFYSHVDSKGVICYTTKDNLAWDKRYSETLLNECCVKVIKIVQTWNTSVMKTDLQEEFLSYWAMLCSNSISMLNVKSYLQNIDGFKKVDFVYTKKESYIFDENSSLKDKILSSYMTGAECYYLPLRENSDIIPPDPKIPLNAEIFKKMIVGNLSSSVKRRFKKWCKKRRTKFMLILAVPVSKGNTILIGSIFNYHKLTLPFDKKKKDSCTYTPLLIERRDQIYQLNRTSQDLSFLEKKVAVIGVGSVGSFVAANLSKMGVSKLLIIDDDFITIDNIARHYLGENSLGKDGKFIFKVDAMEEKLLGENPKLNVESEGMSFQQTLQHSATIFDDIDFIFSCVGDTMTNFAINHFFKEKGTPVLYSWLDPYGIGYHNLLIQPEQTGCFMCLSYDEQNGEFVTNRASFAKSGQMFERKLASCYSAFVPYNVIAPSTLANKAVEIFSEFINDDVVNGNFLISQIGQTYTYKNQGFEFSKRFEICVNDSRKLSYTLQKNHYCPECNGAFS